jgi:hypothetical protein
MAERVLGQRYSSEVTKKQRERDRKEPRTKLLFKDMPLVTYFPQLGPTS